MIKSKPPDAKASDAATRILRELGVKNSNRGEKPSSDPKPFPVIATRAKIPEEKPTPKKTMDVSLQPEDKYKIYFLQVGYVALGGLVGIILLFQTAGYLNLFDRSILQQLVEFKLHHIKFNDELDNRLIDNFFNIEPLVVIEGSVKNQFSSSDDLGHIQLKALAFDENNHLLESRTIYAGILLSDEELMNLGRNELLRLYKDSNGSDVLNKNLFKEQNLSFQIVFFNTNNQVARTSVQIVSYRRNGLMVYVNSPDPQS